MHQQLNQPLTSSALVPATRAQFRFRLQAEANNSSHVLGLQPGLGTLGTLLVAFQSHTAQLPAKEPTPPRAGGLVQGQTADTERELGFASRLAQLPGAGQLHLSAACPAHASMPGPGRALFLFVENN